MGSGLVVTGGVLRGRRLKPPADRAVRPTAARVREAIFSILGQQFDGQRVLDLFAGTGVMGIEAASRGASDLVFVEQSRPHVQLIETNCRLAAGIATTKVLCRDACKVMPTLSEGLPFDFVFLDPPYGAGLAAACLDAMAPLADGLLTPGAVVVVETDGREQLPAHLSAWSMSDNRTYGQTSLNFYQHRGAKT
jgi:16S rRNA (guanine966-N2)-methyltransferase